LTLLDRFVDPEDSIPIHAFLGAIHLILRGKITRAQLVAGFNLDDTAGNDKAQLIPPTVHACGSNTPPLTW